MIRCHVVLVRRGRTVHATGAPPHKLEGTRRCRGYALPRAEVEQLTALARDV